MISTQHSPDISIEDLRQEVQKHIIDAVIPAAMVNGRTKYHAGLWWAVRTAIRG